MIVRVVKMHFKPENISAFQSLFAERKERIRGFAGCTHLELWQDVNEPGIFFTYSHWNLASDLEAYRHSNLFNETWKLTKALFAEKAQAWSVEPQVKLP